MSPSGDGCRVVPASVEAVPGSPKGRGRGIKGTIKMDLEQLLAHWPLEVCVYL